LVKLLTVYFSRQNPRVKNNRLNHYTIPLSTTPKTPAYITILTLPIIINYTTPFTISPTKPSAQTKTIKPTIPITSTQTTDRTLIPTPTHILLITDITALLITVPITAPRAGNTSPQIDKQLIIKDL